MSDNMEDMSPLDSEFEKQLSKIIPREYKEWGEAPPDKLPLTAATYIKRLQNENKMLWDVNEKVRSALDLSSYYSKF